MPETETDTTTENEDRALFPELDMDNAQDKELFRAAKRYSKAKRERDEVLSTAKEKVDSAREKLVGLMRGKSISKFKHDGTIVEIFEGRTKVVVKEEGEEEEDESED